jgi:hypothetical protein
MLGPIILDATCPAHYELLTLGNLGLDIFEHFIFNVYVAQETRVFFFAIIMSRV